MQKRSFSISEFIQLQDCLSSFNLPSIMDCKIGVRTYLEEELEKAKVHCTLFEALHSQKLRINVISFRR